MKYFNARTILYTKLEDTEMPVYEKYSDSRKTCMTFLHEMIVILIKLLIDQVDSVKPNAMWINGLTDIMILK